MSQAVVVERDRDVAFVRISRPDKRNALDFAVMDGLIDAAKSMKSDRTLRAVVLHGEGESFCSGLDFPSVTRKPGRIFGAFLRMLGRDTNRFQEVWWAWRRLPVPVIAALHGHCFGGGMQIALAADFRIAAPDCQLSIMEAKWGLIPDMSGSVSLRELLPADQAKLLAMTGRILSGDEAHALGLVTAVADAPLESARALAAELSARSPDALAATKALFQQTWVADEAEAFRAERRLQARVLLGDNQRAAMKAATKKREPSYGPRGRAMG